MTPAEANFEMYINEVKFYFDSFFLYRHSRFLRSNQGVRWHHRLYWQGTEPKEAAQIIYRAFYLYNLYEVGY